MNEENQRKTVDSCPGSFVDSMGGSSISNSNVTAGSNPGKRTLPLLYVQPPISKNLNSAELNNSFTVPKVSPVSSVSNGVNGGKTIQAFVGTLINKKCQQKVLLTPVKPGQEKQAGVARLLLQGQRSGTIGQVARLSTATPTTSASAGPNTPTLSVVLPTQGKQMCTSYVVSPVSSNSNTTPTSTSTTTSSTGNSTSNSPLVGNRPTLSIRNAVLIDSANSNSQSKSVQPNIIRQKMGPDCKITVSSLLKPSGMGGTSSLLSKVLSTPPHQSKISFTSPSVQLKSDSKKEDSKDQSADVVLIEDDDDDELDGNCKSSNSSSQESNTPRLSVGMMANGIKDSTGASDNSQEVDSGKVITSPILDRARKRKGLIATSEPPVKIAKQQDKLKLLPGAEDFDPFKVVEWEPNGIGLLPGSNIKMTVNELGMLTVADATLAERGAAPATSTSDEDDGKCTNKKGNELDSILCCVCCSCYGLPAEFYNASYCSTACRDAVLAQEEAIVRKIEQEQNPDNDQKKKPRPAETTGTSASEDNIDKGKKKNKLGDTEAENNKEEENKIPGYMDGVIKQYSTNEEEYNAALLKAKKIVKKGKILNSDMKCQQSIKIVKPEVKTAVVTNGTTCTTEKNVSLVKTSKLETKQKQSVTADAPKSKPNRSLSKVDVGKIKALLSLKSKLPSHEVSQDLDCGILTPNRPEKADTQESSEQFPWASYLADTGSRAAWVKLFNNPFPPAINLFQIGYKLEAVDPEHQSNICAVTVVKIKGYRLKLHFDCYSGRFDFWVNVDSPNIYPCGFCSRHNIPLSPPQGHSKDTFNWLSYNTLWMATAAPASCFPTYSISSSAPNLFRVGMKLEAVDRKNTFLVCVATVAGVIENRILVHFDSWGEVYDYWVDTSSPYIRPVGWCQENNHELTPPNGIKSSEFNWAQYLLKTNSEAAPNRAFTLRPHIEFRRGMKLEAVDKRAPHLLRVATVKDVLPYQIKIVFDGFPDHFGYWVDDDSPDLHPVGWAAHTGHPLEPPPSMNAPSPCPTPGCLGQGHLRTNALENHSRVEDCPYDIDHLNSESYIPDRFVNFGCPYEDKAFEDDVINLDNDDSGEESDEDISKKRWKWLGIREGVREKSYKPKEPPKIVESKKPNQKKVKRRKRRKKCIKATTESKDTSDNELKPEEIDKKEPFISENNPMKWSTKQVVEFSNSVLGSIDNIQLFEKEETSSSGSSEDNTEEIERRSVEEFSSFESMIHSPLLKRVEFNSSYTTFKTNENSTVVENSSNNQKKIISKNNRDHFAIYGEYLAEKLRLLDKRSCAFVQKAFSDALFKAELGKFREELETATPNKEIYQTNKSGLQIINTTVTTSAQFRNTKLSSLRWNTAYK